MTLKDKIFETLQPLGIPIAYNDSDVNVLPRINFSLVSHYSVKVSNRKHRQIVRYQVDVFSNMPLNVEDDPLLLRIEQALTKALVRCSDWVELSTIDTNEDIGLYHYYIEVWQ